jgi:hypothetical protein
MTPTTISGDSPCCNHWHKKTAVRFSRLVLALQTGFLFCHGIGWDDSEKVRISFGYHDGGKIPKALWGILGNVQVFQKRALYLFCICWKPEVGGNRWK